MPEPIKMPLTLEPGALQGAISIQDTPTPITGGRWHIAPDAGDGLVYCFEDGMLEKAQWLTADLLLDGNKLAIFMLTLQEGAEGPCFTLTFGLLNQCQARMRLPIDAVLQKQWKLQREGAWLKPLVGGDLVNLARVDRMTLTVERKAEAPVHWCMTPLTATVEPPERLTEPILPRGPLLDELGQSTLHEWPGRTKSEEELSARLEEQHAEASDQQWPETWSRWGGLAEEEFEGSGFFRTHNDGQRWWLIDPAGNRFWSAGCDCVRMSVSAMYRDIETALMWTPDRHGPYGTIYSERKDGLRFIDYLQANFIRVFDPEKAKEAWARIALAQLRRFGFNTVANWSDWQVASAAGFPYVRPLSPSFPNTSMIFRDFPDVFDPAFESDAATYADQLRESAADPAMIGYFLMNEPNWGFSNLLPAEGMLRMTRSCATRRELADFLRKRYDGDEMLSDAWGIETTLDAVAEGDWTKPITAEARKDLEAFSTRMVARLFGMLSDACRKVDANHLNLGARYYTVPPRWAFEGMQCFDVFSVNGYGERVKPELGLYSEEIERPIMIGEWHFGALDAGLPASGIGHVRDQAARGRAYRVYLEDAASKPWCVGVHWFTLYDESALGRFDGENWNIGFMDICHRPYGPLAQCARVSHERLYAVARGEVEPFDEAPEYLPLVFN